MTPPNTEDQARETIDKLLTGAGWVVQDYRAYNPGAALGVAVREVPLSEGTCDYLLMVDRAAMGIIEAKREGTRLSGVVEQSAFYAGKLPYLDIGRLPVALRHLKPYELEDCLCIYKADFAAMRSDFGVS